MAFGIRGRADAEPFVGQPPDDILRIRIVGCFATRNPIPSQGEDVFDALRLKIDHVIGQCILG